MPIQLAKNKQHNVIKRNGSIEPYSSKKLTKAINWCTDNNKVLTKILLNALSIKIYDKIKIDKLWDEVINTASNLVSEMYPIWDKVAEKAYLLKVYKETYNSNPPNKCYPNYYETIKKGVSANVYTSDLLTQFTEEEFITLGSYIDESRDTTFPFIGLITLMDKYAINYTLTKKLELPQHIYMRVAIAPYLYDKSENRLEKIKKRYDDLSTFLFTEATPKMVNSLTPKPQLASCVLNEVDDTTESINYTDTALSTFSKYGGGLALDISKLRCTLSPIGKNGGRSDGPIPFIKKFKATIGAFNQNGKRKGALIITFPFWHYDVKNLLMLKDAGGSEDNRARTLQYAIKWYHILTTRIKEDGYITLFDPKEVPLLNQTYGDEFEKAYLMYEQKVGIRKQKIPARDLAFLISKIRSETGNLYITFVDNINKQRMTYAPVFASNLCQEVVLSVKASTDFISKILINFETNSTYTVNTVKTGEIALCNLSSVNIMKWIKLSHTKKQEFVYNLLEASDNLITHQYYPIKEGEYANKRHRAIGIGVSNEAAYIASNKLLHTDKETELLLHELYEDLSYYILEGSVKLAKKRGAYSTYKDSYWFQGLIPLDLSLSKINYKYKHDWNYLRQQIKRYGIRFSYHMAIAPTATSSQVIQATEGIEPVKQLSMMKEGTYTLPILVPNIHQYRQWYQSAFDIPISTANTLNSIRQKFVDQSISFSHYYQTTNSSFEIINDIIDAESKGLKTLYYLQPLKSDLIKGCESCSS